MITMRFVMIGLSFVLLTTAVGQSYSAEEQILLKAGSVVITRQDLQQALLVLPESEQTQAFAGLDSLKKFLDQLYMSKKMAIEAEQLGLDQTPLTQAQLAIQRRFVLADALRNHTQEQIKMPDFTALAREHYAAHRDEFQLPKQFKAAHILKRVQCDCERDSQRQKIEQLLTQLRTGADFATLAKAESEDPGSATHGGDLGQWLKSKDLVAPFADALTKLEVGQFSDVVETKFGFHIIKKLDEQPSHQQSFDEVQRDIEQRLQQVYVQNQLQQKLQAYKPGADAQFDDAALQDLLRDH